MLTTTTVLADMASQVACGQLEVVSITKPGAEVHGYEPTPSDLRRAQGAKLLLENGLGLELWAHRFRDQLRDVPVVTLSAGIEPIRISSMAQSASGQAASGHGSAAARSNPHAWMSPRAGRRYVANLRDAFSRFDPANAATYQRCAADYDRKLAALEDELRQELAVLSPERRLLVSCEGAFSYLARDYGLEELYLWPVNAESEATPKKLEQVIRQVRQRQVPAVFCESTVDSRMQQQVARESGARFGGVFYVDSLSDPGGPAASYIQLLRHNVSILVRGLGGR
ncbi:MAG: zinc ABC transporter substrate-binding protein [Prochlorococcaceae cyanobacterium]